MSEAAHTLSEYPYLEPVSKEHAMDIVARVTSKGQITIPKAVRDALGLEAGDQVLFRVDDKRAVLTRTPDFLDLAGTIEVPPDKVGMAWEDIIREARDAWVSRNL